MMTQNHFEIPATVLEKFRSRGFPEGVTLTADHCTVFHYPPWYVFSLNFVAQVIEIILL